MTSIFLFCRLSRFNPLESMSMLITVAFFSEASKENLPVSAPISITICGCALLIEAETKMVSMHVRYFPIRVLEAFSQYVSSQRYFSIMASETSSATVFLLTLICWFYFNINRYQGKFLAAVGTFSVILLENLIRRFKFCAFIQNMVASLANNSLRHYLALPELADLTSATYLLVTKIGFALRQFLNRTSFVPNYILKKKTSFAS